MKRILVTGGAGFIGSHLTDALLQRDDRVTVVDDISTGAVDNLAQAKTSDRFTFVEGDVGDADLVAQLTCDVDEVYHLAAAVGVALIAREPIQTIQRNIEPTRLILDAMRHQHERGRHVKLFIASTSEVYGKNPKPTWNEEDDLVLGSTTRPRWSYGASKAIDEFLTLAYWRQYKLPIVIGRFFNVVGPRQSGAYGMVLPRLVDAAMSGGPLIVHDDGRQARCFAHVSDVIAAVLALMQTPEAVGRVFNIGSDAPITILELAEKVAAAAGTNPEIHFQTYRQAYGEDFEDIRRRVPDLTRLRETVDYQPQFDLDRIIGQLIELRKNQ